MHGIIQLEFQKFATERYGEQAWQALTQKAELGEEISPRCERIRTSSCSGWCASPKT